MANCCPSNPPTLRPSDPRTPVVCLLCSLCSLGSLSCFSHIAVNHPWTLETSDPRTLFLGLEARTLGCCHQPNAVSYPQPLQTSNPPTLLNSLPSIKDCRSCVKKRFFFSICLTRRPGEHYPCQTFCRYDQGFYRFFPNFDF